MPSLVPLEKDEQIALVQWLELKHYTFTAIPNSTYTTSWKQKALNKATGLRAGFPDLLIITKNCPCLIAIELKRVKGGVVSPEQKKWLKALNAAGVPAMVCNGFDEAIKFINEMEK